MSINNLYLAAKDQLASLTKKAYDSAVADGALLAGAPDPQCEIPKDRSFGDVTTTFAMQAAKALKKNPRQIAESIIQRLNLADSYLREPSVMGAGFINARLSDKWYSDVLAAASSPYYGRGNDGANRKIMVEFVSANPTGPMTIGNARGGVLGDTLTAVLEMAGYGVWREFYLNDAGNQIEKFADSLEARYLQIFDSNVEMPESAYQGADITEHSQAFAEIYGDKYKETTAAERRSALVDFAFPKNIAALERDLLKYRIEYDCWFKESSLHKSGAVDRIIELMKKSGYTYEADGALWFRSSEFGDEKDRVLLRSNGLPTYLVPDIAYHYDKLITRGFDVAINIWGADHHGYIARMKAAMQALGIDPNRLQVIIMQMVRLVKDGEVYKQSKRSGKALTLETLLDEVPIDAARFFFNNRRPDSHLEFDMELAVREDSENPVYYIQYAHARITSMLKLLADEGAPPPSHNAAILTHELERELIRQVALYPEEIRLAARDYEPSRINAYLVELANCFHRFYNAVRLRGAESGILAARIGLCASVLAVLKNGLTVLGISAPEKM